MRRVLLAAAVVAMPIGVLAASGAASASVGKVDVSQDSVACTLGSASVQLSPKVTTNLKHRENLLFAFELKRCVVSGPDAASFAGVNVTGDAVGVLHGPTTGISGLPATLPTKGKITIDWSAPGVHLTTKHSKLSIGSVTVSAATDGNAVVAIGNTSVKDDFGGSDGGASSVLSAETTESLSSLENTVSTTGLHAVHLTGSLSLG